MVISLTNLALKQLFITVIMMTMNTIITIMNTAIIIKVTTVEIIMASTMAAVKLVIHLFPSTKTVVNLLSPQLI